jgi:hypothetical protein
MIRDGRVENADQIIRTMEFIDQKGENISL